ncbi:MAG: cell division protein ZipA [Gammaproteobacteria bacterium]|nr:cell division protein ZipA [Gammaproteobacteria bacterium]
MENLRWILLAAGIFFILAIYFVGRQRRRNNSSDLFDAKEDIPEFSARDWDELEEGVGKVRIVARERIEDDFSDDLSAEPLPERNEPFVMADEQESAQSRSREYIRKPDLTPSGDLFEELDEVESPPVEEPPAETQDRAPRQQKSSNVDIIVLYILAKPNKFLTGEKINSVAQANGFEFGRMNIFHRLDEKGQAIFSLANMMEPGNFDPDTIHSMKTSGLTVFMQLSNLTHPADDFDEMLRSAYYMSEMLDARLCNQERQPITQADAEYYRKLIAEKENA